MVTVTAYKYESFGIWTETLANHTWHYMNFAGYGTGANYLNGLPRGPVINYSRESEFRFICSNDLNAFLNVRSLQA